MESFFSKYSFLIIWIVVIAVVGVLFIWIVQPSLHPAPPATLQHPSTGANGSSVGQPPSPTISIVIQSSTTGRSLFINWQNLPAGTTELNIFRGFQNSTSGWSLWKTLSLDPGQLGNGSSLINLGPGDNGYSYYIEAVNNSGNNSSTIGNGNSPMVLWTSGVTDPVVVTSTIPVAPYTPPPSNSPQPSSTNQSPSNSTTSNSQNGSSSNPTPTPPPTPNGTPYYSPNQQNTEYGSAQTQNFWVQHVDNKIQIGWQNLPPTTTDLVILRSENQGGPWSVVLTQENPGVNGSYSIQVVDDTLGVPYFYEMNAAEGSTTIATYGPVYLNASASD
jgi:hypothetical protein